MTNTIMFIIASSIKKCQTKTKTVIIQVLKSWQFISENIIDHENGEWLWAVNENGEKDTTNDKAGFWKCPYHNGRMCLELIERIGSEL